MGNVRADEIAAVCRELAAARAVPADVDTAIIEAVEAACRVTSAEQASHLNRNNAEIADAKRDYSEQDKILRATIARAIADRQPATVGGLLAHLASGKPFTSPRWLAGHVLRVDVATGRLWRLDYNDPDELHLTRYVLSDRAFSISDVMADDYAVVADTPVMDHAWRTRPATRGPLPKGG